MDHAIVDPHAINRDGLEIDIVNCKILIYVGTVEGKTLFMHRGGQWPFTLCHGLDNDLRTIKGYRKFDLDGRKYKITSNINVSPRVIHCASLSIVVTTGEMKLKFVAMFHM